MVGGYICKYIHTCVHVCMCVHVFLCVCCVSAVHIYIYNVCVWLQLIVAVVLGGATWEGRSSVIVMVVLLVL